MSSLPNLHLSKMLNQPMSYRQSRLLKLRKPLKFRKLLRFRNFLKYCKLLNHLLFLQMQQAVSHQSIGQQIQEQNRQYPS